MWDFFSPIRCNTGVFLVSFSGGHLFKYYSLQLTVLFLQSYRCIIQIFSNQSWSFRSHVSNSLKYPDSFSNSSRCLFIFSSFFFNSYGGLLKILFHGYHINSFVVFQILPMVRRRPSQVYVISLLIFSTRISNMSNPLIVINLIGQG